MRKSVAARLQFSKAEAAAPISQRHRVRRSFALRVKKLMNGRVSRIICFRPVPVHVYLAPLTGRQQGQFRDCTIRIRRRSFQKRAPVLNQAADHLRFEDVGVVCYRTDNALRSLVYVYIQIELGSAGWNVRLCRTPATVDSGNRRLDRDRHLKKWVTAWIGSGPNSFDQFRKRYIAVRQRTQNRLPHANQQLLKCWVPCNVDSK